MNVTLVLDAMGVIFASADDVVELLQPFIISRGGEKICWQCETCRFWRG